MRVDIGVWLRAENGQPNDGADIYDFRSKRTESSRLRRIEMLERENSLLRRMVTEIDKEIILLGKLLGS
jgi:hypothetical protein